MQRSVQAVERLLAAARRPMCSSVVICGRLRVWGRSQALPAIVVLHAITKGANVLLR